MQMANISPLKHSPKEKLQIKANPKSGVAELVNFFKELNKELKMRKRRWPRSMLKFSNSAKKS